MDENQNYLARSRTSMITRDKWKASVKEGWTPTPVNKDDQRPARHHLRHQIRRQTKQETTQVCQETNEGKPKETKGDKGPRKRKQRSLGDKWKETKEDKGPQERTHPPATIGLQVDSKGWGVQNTDDGITTPAPSVSPSNRCTCPWLCTFWKILPCGWRVQLQLHSDSRSPNERMLVWALYDFVPDPKEPIFSLQISGSSLIHRKRLRRTCEYVGTYRDFLICPASSCHKSFHSYVHKSLAHMYVICPSKRARFTFSEVLQVRLACSLVAELAGPPETYCWHVLLASTEMVPCAIKYFRCAQ